MLRREFLAMLASVAAAPVFAANEPGIQLGAPAEFTTDVVRKLAIEKARKPYKPQPLIPDAWQNLSYDEYRMIWFDSRNALWQKEQETPLKVDVFPPGLYYPRAVKTFAVSDGQARAMQFDLNVFDRSDMFPEVPIDDTLGYSGLRLRSELREPGIFEEFAVFQGASYFRGIGTGQTYGLSARGLAIRTGDPAGEEFPDFTHFWIEQPEPGASSVVMHCLLDSPSCTGAYRFEIVHGETLVMNVETEIFARTDLTHVGIAPLTSMYLFDDMDRNRFDDFAPQSMTATGC